MPPEAGRFAAGFGGRAGGELTMRMQACFPSMKPFGMAFAARISYLETKGRSHQPRASPSFLPPLALLTHHPTCARPSRLTVGGTPGRQSCWGSPGGRYGCLLTPRCTAAAPAPETHPVCQTAEAERAMDHQVWDSGSHRPRISGLGGLPHLVTRNKQRHQVRSQLRVQVTTLVFGAVSIT